MDPPKERRQAVPIYAGDREYGAHRPIYGRCHRPDDRQEQARQVDSGGRPG